MVDHSARSSATRGDAQTKSARQRLGLASDIRDSAVDETVARDILLAHRVSTHRQGASPSTSTSIASGRPSAYTGPHALRNGLLSRGSQVRPGRRIPVLYILNPCSNGTPGRQQPIWPSTTSHSTRPRLSSRTRTHWTVLTCATRKRKRVSCVWDDRPLAGSSWWRTR